MKKTSINSWLDIGLRELFFAFRKAKADCFFERPICIARQFAEYESQLPAHLSALMNRLHGDDIGTLLEQNLGELRIVAKKLGFEPKKGVVNGHGFFSAVTHDQRSRGIGRPHEFFIAL